MESHIIEKPAEYMISPGTDRPADYGLKKLADIWRKNI